MLFSSDDSDWDDFIVNKKSIKSKVKRLHDTHSFVVSNDYIEYNSSASSVELISSSSNDDSGPTFYRKIDNQRFLGLEEVQKSMQLLSVKESGSPALLSSSTTSSANSRSSSVHFSFEITPPKPHVNQVHVTSSPLEILPTASLKDPHLKSSIFSSLSSISLSTSLLHMNDTGKGSQKQQPALQQESIFSLSKSLSMLELSFGSRCDSPRPIRKSLSVLLESPSFNDSIGGQIMHSNVKPVPLSVRTPWSSPEVRPTIRTVLSTMPNDSPSRLPTASVKTKTSSKGKKIRALSPQPPLPSVDPTDLLQQIVSSPEMFEPFKRTREKLVAKLFAYYNSKVFQNKLPSNLQISWNSRLTKTAGQCRCQRRVINAWQVRRRSHARLSMFTAHPTASRRSCGSACVRVPLNNGANVMELSASIELSIKVCHNAERTRDTLIHELCHAAVWLINGRGQHGGHGPLWKSWVAKAQTACPTLPPIRVTHSYTIESKFTYRCVQCGVQVNRHSRSVNLDKQVCAFCHGKFQLFLNTPDGRRRASQVPQSQPNKFALFVRNHYRDVSIGSPTLASLPPSTPGRHGMIMKELAKRFHEMKCGDVTPVK